MGWGQPRAYEPNPPPLRPPQSAYVFSELDRLPLSPPPPPPSTAPPLDPPLVSSLLTVSTLQTLLGINNNPLWGDLSNSDTRLLYHSLLPRALLRLQEEAGIREGEGERDPSELSAVAFCSSILTPPSPPSSGWDPSNPLSLYQAAYLSYRLRHTAKLYARYRCNLPGRVLTEVYDGFRHWREYGVWKAEGRGWEETWER